MALIVQKYGGTSVGSIERIEAVADRVAKHHAAGDQLIVVVSAMSGETNRLLGLADEISNTPDPRELDMLVSTGEQVSMALLAMSLHKRGIGAISLKGSQVAIKTDSFHSKARIKDIDATRLHTELAEGKVVIVAGFQGVDERGETTTLGRGGSDTSAVALAAAVKAAECQIYTDVDGVYTTDPRVVDGAQRLDSITFEEMLEMASMGSKVLHLRSVEFAGKYGIPLRVLSSFKDGPGTLISVDNEENLMEAPTIAGIAFNRDEAKLTVVGVPDTPGIAYQILGPIGDANIEVDVILQNVGDEGKTDFTFTVSRNDLARAEAILDTHISELGAMKWRSDSRIAKVSVVGVGMRSHSGVAATMFRALSEVGVNIQMISTSEIKISVIIEEKFLELAVRALHSVFGLDAEEAGDTES
ncbi:MAG: aspartate kinase [Halieaceae bacterium]|jgi:aspartate kinase